MELKAENGACCCMYIVQCTRWRFLVRGGPDHLQTVEWGKNFEFSSEIFWNSSPDHYALWPENKLAWANGSECFPLYELLCKKYTFGIETTTFWCHFVFFFSNKKQFLRLVLGFMLKINLRWQFDGIHRLNLSSSLQFSVTPVTLFSISFRQFSVLCTLVSTSILLHCPHPVTFREADVVSASVYCQAPCCILETRMSQLSVADCFRHWLW